MCLDLSLQNIAFIFSSHPSELHRCKVQVLRILLAKVCMVMLWLLQWKKYLSHTPHFPENDLPFKQDIMQRLWGCYSYVLLLHFSVFCVILYFFVMGVARAHFLHGFEKKLLAIVKSLSVKSFGLIHGMKIAVYSNSLARYLCISLLNDVLCRSCISVYPEFSVSLST